MLLKWPKNVAADHLHALHCMYFSFKTADKTLIRIRCFMFMFRSLKKNQPMVCFLSKILFTLLDLQVKWLDLHRKGHIMNKTMLLVEFS